MTLVGSREAQAEADRIRMFREELAELERRNVLLLSPEQHAQLETHFAGVLHDLAGRYDVDTSESQKQISWGMRIATALGAIALCFAVYLLFLRYWGHWATPVQAAILVIGPLLLVAATEWMARREGTIYYTALLACVAFASFVLNLTVLGRIFNMTSTPNALAAWGIFALALAYPYGLRLLLTAGLVCLLSFTGAQSEVWRGNDWIHFGSRPENFLGAGLALIALPLYLRHERNTDFPPVYRLAGTITVLLAMIALCASGHWSYLPLDERTVEKLYQFAGMAASAGFVWLGIRRGWNGIVNTGAIFFTIFLVIRLYHWWWDWMPSYLFFFAIGGIAIGLMAAFKRARQRIRGAA